MHGTRSALEESSFTDQEESVSRGGGTPLAQVVGKAVCEGRRARPGGLGSQGTGAWIAAGSEELLYVHLYIHLIYTCVLDTEVPE